MNMAYKTESEEETMAFAAKFANKIKADKKGVICLYGNLGAGKTVFVKGFSEALGVESKVIKSPTYTYLREYKLDDFNIYHFDFYRLENIDEALIDELNEICKKPDSFVLIEWPEKINEILPSERTDLFLEIGEKANIRNIKIKQNAN